MEQKSVSIVLCTFNGEKYLRQQLDTLLQQTYPVLEILVQDDCSTDGTMDILEEYAARHPQFRICRNAVRLGVNGNFFSAMRKARGEYIAVCDQDDLWAPEKIEKQMKAIGNHLLCACRSKPFSSDGTPVAYDPRTPNYHLIRLLYCSIPGHSMVFRRQLIELLPDTSQDYHTYYDVYLSLTAASNDRVVLVDEWLVSQRRHEGAHTYTKPDNRRTPSAGNALFILKWSLRNFRRVQPYMYEYFQRRLRLMQGIKADSPLYEEALSIVRLEGRSGWVNLLRLCRLHVRHRHHLFYTEGRGLLNFIRAALYCIMQAYNYQYLMEQPEE